MTYDITLGREQVSTRPAVRRIGSADLRIALARGWDDFRANRTDVIFLCALYPLVGLLLGRAVAGGTLLPLLFPLVAGFALVGPLAALGLYEISRRREQGLETSWRDAFRVLRAPNFGAVLLLGLLLMGIFVLWLQSAQALYQALFAGASAGVPGFLDQVFTTPSGWMLILLGHLVGFVFALIVLTLTVVSFPLLLDRDLEGDAGRKASLAVATSAAAVRRNLVPMLGWGLLVAAILMLASVPLLLGLAVALPVLGHATWHLYRRTIEPG